MRNVYVALLALTTAALLAPGAAEGQSLSERMKKRAEEAAKRSVEQRVEKRAGEATEAVLDGAEATAKCAAGKPCPEGAKEGAAAPGAAAAPAASSAAAPAPGGKAARPGEGAWANYDFKPGERPIFVDDFTRDNVGDFPRRLEFQKGNMEVVEWQGGRYLRATGSTGGLFIPLNETLPDRFTMEFDFAGLNKYEMKLTFNGDPNSPGDQVLIGEWGSGVDGSVKAISKMPDKIEERMVKVRVMADGDYVKVYVDSQRVANVPNAKLGRSNKIHMTLPVYVDRPILVGNVRVMAGGRDLYDALSEKGRVATQGIYFATGSDVLQPESTPTLKEIAAMLAEHADLALTIEGHTDNVGAAAANASLSQRRADAVKAYLVQTHGVAESRLQTKGLGDTKPAAPNSTPEGRQQNRRVELVKG